MKLFKNNNIRSKLIFSFSILFILVFVLSAGFLYSLRNIIYYQNSAQDFKKLHVMVLEMRNAETAFMKYDQTNEKFFKTGTSKYIKKLEDEAKKAEVLLSQIKDRNLNVGFSVNSHLDSITKNLKLYTENVLLLKAASQERGFKDWGVVGTLRQAIHKVEKSGIPHDKVLMLTLRRNEKDFLLRKDKAKYLPKFLGNIEKFEASINNDTSIDDAQRAELLSSVSNYRKSFDNMVGIQEKIGLTEASGINGMINHHAEKVEEKIAMISKEVNVYTSDSITSVMWLIIGGLIAIFALFLILMRRLINNLEKPIVRVRDYLNRLAKGIVPKRIKEETSDVILQTINNSLNNIIDRNSTVADFTQEIGKGNYKAKIKILDKKDELGKALNSMKDSLVKAREEEAERNYVDGKRKWVSEGIAKFATILREDNDNLQRLCDNILSNLIKYVDANQGAIYLLREENKEKYLEKFAVYAYSRKKHIGGKLDIGEGIVGQAFLEKQKVFRKDIPDQFYKITSGLGEATPGCLFVVPLLFDEKVHGVIELASFNEFDEYEMELIETIASNFGSALYNAKINERTKVLLGESQYMAEELRAQEEEMRQNMEEMQATQEEMGRKEKEYLEEIALLKTKINS